MSRSIATLFVTACLAVQALALTSTLQTVTNWGGANPNNLGMQIYVPTTVKSKPAVVLAVHYCSGSGQAFFQGTEWASLADQYGFVVIYPSIPNTRNPLCWDVCTSTSLTHNGGSDTLTLANMVKYAWSKYGSDASRTFVTGTSSGAMMTQAMMGTYPDMFVAGAEFAGVPFACFATTGGSLWNSQCAQGQRIYSASVWGDYVRNAYPGYSGKYPRFMAWHGTADETINYNNFGESVKQWTNVHGISQTATKTDKPTSAWTRSFYGSPDASGQYSVVAISESGVGHGGVLANGMLKYVVDFFGIPSLSNGGGPTTTTTTRASTTSTARPPTTSTTTTTKPQTSPTNGTGNCSAKWGQCGGIGWAGPTCCVSGTTCTKSNDYYSQCL
ncbi:acetyl xylan esterase [Cladochytrium replicatum]|nr:acetyl xylan esterase [Cladochytrium replicatum]